MTPIHRPVMVQEVVELLGADRGGVFVDATLGAAGHTRAILETHPANRVVALDRDPETLERSGRSLGGLRQRVELHHLDYRQLEELWSREQRPPVDGILADFGISTTQLLDPERGFSFDREGPLDMRMDRSRGPTAADLVNSLPQQELRRLISHHGEERYAAPISRAIVRRRATRPFRLTTDLAAVVVAAVPRRPQRLHPATRTFQALRIAVNDELTGLGTFVRQCADLVRPGGRLVFVSFHSLEDRPVKRALRDLSHRCLCPPDLPVCGCRRPDLVRLLTPRVLRPRPQEVRDNPAARSARLRAAERLAA